MNAQPFIPTSRDRILSRPRLLADALLNLLYPESCFVCAAPVGRHQDRGMCAACWDKAMALRIQPPWCTCCGIPFQGFDPEPGHLCSDCMSSLPPFSGARAFGYYDGELSRAVQEFKFRGRRNLSSLLGPLAARAVLGTWSREEIDLICPIPLHPRRRRERGFNQSELIAGSISDLLAIPLWHRALSRTRNTPPQVGLTDPERLRNVRGAFHVPHPGRVSGKRILLVDDVMTTGATLRSAARALLDADALRVYAVTVARAV